MIASIVLGIDDDTIEDMNRSIDFAKSIHAYQLQPAILTPYPGTPVFEQYEKEGRMISHDWSLFDMMNVTFKPANETPWELQDEFYNAAKYFYDFKSAKQIGQIFGKEYGRRRWGLALMARLGVWGAHFCSNHVKISSYYKLRHYDPEAKDMDGSITKRVIPVLSKETERRSSMEIQLEKEAHMPA